jgi:hypothetical protein
MSAMVAVIVEATSPRFQIFIIAFDARTSNINRRISPSTQRFKDISDLDKSSCKERRTLSPIAAAKAVSQNLMHDSLTTTEKIYGKLTQDQVRREIAALTQLDQSTTDTPLDVIIHGFSENPEMLVEPLASAVIQRLPDAPSSFVETLAEATAQCLLAKQNVGAP